MSNTRWKEPNYLSGEPLLLPGGHDDPADAARGGGGADRHLLPLSAPLLL